MLGERVRQGLWLVLGATLLFALSDLSIAPDVLVPVYALKVAQVTFVGCMLLVLRHERSRRQVLWSALLTINVTYVLMVSGDVLKGQVETAPMVAVVLGMAAAAVLPWGVGPQMATATLMLVGTLVALWRSGRPFDAVVDPAASVFATLVVSVYVADAFERYRAQRRAAEDALTMRAQLEAVRADARLAAASRPTFAGVAQGAAEALVRHLGVARATVWWRDGDTGRCTLVAHAGEGEAPAEAIDIDCSVESLEARLAGGGARRVEEPMVCAHRVVVGGAALGALGVSASAPLAPVVRSALVSIGEVVQDTRERMRNDEARARLLEELERTNRMKSQFVSTMSHELRTPLNVILGYADLLDELDGEERCRAVGRISSAGRELLELIEATLDMNRLEAGRDAVEITTVELDELWSELQGELDAVPRPAVLTLSWAPAPPLMLRTDRRKLKTVLKNLVGNALKFTREGGVYVDCRLEDGRCTFAVRDTGIGIAHEELPQIFDMFHQVDSSDRRTYGGVGLGLHIVQRFCQQLGASVAVESVLGEGSTFVVRLPADASAARAA